MAERKNKNTTVAPASRARKPAAKSKSNAMSRSDSPKRRAAKTKNIAVLPSEESSCFTIMPFGGYFDTYYSDIFKPAIEEAGLKPCRADDLFRPSAIVNDIWSMTKSAKLILADLTGKNPNVFYELGLAHALAKPAILVTESLEDVPFDLRGLRIIDYNKNDPAWGGALRERITASIRETLQSPESAVLPTFLDSKNQSPKPKLTPEEREVVELKQDVRMLQRELALIQDRGLRPMLSSTRESSGLRIRSSDEADALIRDYLVRKVSLPAIEEVLVAGGAPREWTRKRIKALMDLGVIESSDVLTDGPN